MSYENEGKTEISGHERVSMDNPNKPTGDAVTFRRTKEWAEKTVAGEDYLPWADVAAAKEFLGIPVDGLTDEEKAAYAKIRTVKTVNEDPVIKAWRARVDQTLLAMPGVVVEFACRLQDRNAENKVYHDHNNQLVIDFMAPVIASFESDTLDKEYLPRCMDEEYLPYYRVRFADGVVLLAGGDELFSLDPLFHDLVNAVSGAFACARKLDFAGPWDLVDRGSEADKAAFLSAFEAQQVDVPPAHWVKNRNAPPKYLAERPDLAAKKPKGAASTMGM